MRHRKYTLRDITQRDRRSTVTLGSEASKVDRRVLLGLVVRIEARALAAEANPEGDQGQGARLAADILGMLNDCGKAKT